MIRNRVDTRASVTPHFDYGDIVCDKAYNDSYDGLVLTTIFPYTNLITINVFSYRKQSPDLQNTLIDWFLHKRNTRR